MIIIKSEEEKKKIKKRNEMSNKIGSIFVALWFMLLHIILVILEKCGVESDIFILYKISTPLFIIGIFILIIGFIGKKHKKVIELNVIENKYNEVKQKYMITFEPAEEVPDDCKIYYKYETYSNSFLEGCKYSIDECKYENELNYNIIDRNHIEFDLKNYADNDFSYISE